MPTVHLGISVSPATGAAASSASVHTSKTPLGQRLYNLKKPNTHPTKLYQQPSSLPKSGIYGASQMAELFPTVSPEIVVREARLEDCWEVVETHCSSFFPDYSFPLDFMLRVDRLVTMLSGFSVPNGCKRTCLVAVIGSCVNDPFIFGSEDFKIGVLDGKFSFSKGYVTGILTVDTVADFLPKKGPLMQRREVVSQDWDCLYIKCGCSREF